MDILKRNPADKKHQEFHDGEYEYWPSEGGTGSKSGSFPAALVSGLELLAAVVGAVLLAVALSVLYVSTAPVSIQESSAAFNVSIYNNYDGLPVSFAVTPASNPDSTVFSGELDEDNDTITVLNLEGGRRYQIRFYSQEESEKKQIGEFYFVTLGDNEGSEGITAETGIQTQPNASAVTEPQSTVSAETTASTTAESTEPYPQATEETTLPKPPIWYPPAPKETDPSEETTAETESTTEAATEATTEAATEPTTAPTTAPAEPEILAPDLSGINYIPSEDSGDLVPGYYSWTEVHTFRDIPAGTYEIEILHNGTPVTEYTADTETDGELRVSFDTPAVAMGSAATSTVNVTWDDGTTSTSTNTVATPQMQSVALGAVKNPDGTHTFTVTLAVDPGSGFELSCETELYCSLVSDPVSVTLVPQSEDTYVGTYTAMIQTENELEEAIVFVKAIWSAVGEPSDVPNPQSMTNYVEYVP